jgi:muramoyltetrapeptide carboxypeptidase
VERGTFNKMMALTGLTSFSELGLIPDGSNTVKRNSIKPKRLNKGSVIGLVSPASPVSEEAFERTLKNLDMLGLQYKQGDNILKKYGYLAGDDQGRIDDLHKMFADPGIDAVWCIRGGYGTTRILDGLDFALIKDNPKVFIGYSDITALHLAINNKTGLVTFHGPVASSEFTDYTLKCFQNMMFENQTVFDNYPYSEETDPEINKPEAIYPGIMEGRLVGGNLSLLASLAGTKYQLKSEGNIVFIEDIDEKPYRVDRMLTQLIDTSILDKANGILLGVFEGCETKEDEKNTLKIMETLKDRLGGLGIPVFYGFSFGHIKNNCTIPVGIRARFDTDNQQLVLLEKPLI